MRGKDLECSSLAVRNEDLNFAILLSEDTTNQMERIIGFGGQFSNGIQIRDASGLAVTMFGEVVRLEDREWRG